jgi:hypothetical protein
LSDPVRDYELRSSAISPDGATIHLVSATFPKGQRSDPEQPLLWTVVDTSGKIASQGDPLATLPPQTASSISRGPDAGTALFVGADGVANLLLQTKAGELRLLRLRRAPAAADVLPIDLGRGSVVQRMLPLSGGRLLLVGWIDDQALAAVIGPDGRVLTRYQLRQKEMGVVSAAVEPDGGLVIVGQKGPFPNSTTWVGRVSPAGALTTAKEFPGRPMDVARGSDGTTLVLIELKMTEIIAKGLSPDLAETWTRALVSNLPVPSLSFHVAAVQSGGFVVTGTKNRALWVARLKADGSETWADSIDPSTSPEMEMTNHVELAASRDVFAVAYSANVVVGRTQRAMVRAVRFVVK